MAPMIAESMDSMTAKNMAYVFHHVFLPPELPGEGEDKEKNAKDHALICRLKDALAKFKDCVDGREATSVEIALSAIKNQSAVTDPAGSALEERLLRLLPRLHTHGGVIPIHVASQNAGLIIRPENDKILFESFELVPPNSSVMEAQGRIKRFFPGTAVAVGKTTFGDPEFLQTLCTTIGTLSTQDVPEMLGKARKAGAETIEDRDTTNPALVTEFLMAYLQAVGQPSDTRRLWKNTREEVMWSSARQSWHRSPVWLLARVAMQTAFMRESFRSENDLYKELMIFFMAQVLLDAVQVPGMDVRSDVLHCMICKISRRITKLAKTHGDDRLSSRKWFPAVADALAKAESLLQTRLDHISRVSDPGVSMSSLSALDFDADTLANLTDLDSYIHMIINPPHVPSKTKFSPPAMVVSLPAGTLPTEVIPAGISRENKNCSLHYLVAFESWVEHHLPSWLDLVKYQEATCGLVEDLLSSYHKTASLHYERNPENISLMILTCLELWMACDQSATAIHPLLLDYDPDIPIWICQSLLLPLQSQMERLVRIEAYLEERESQANYDLPEIFSSFSKPDSFAVRYFSQSPRQKKLYGRIMQQAAERKAAKIREFHEKKKEYNSFMSEHRRLQCSYYTDSDDITRHDPDCRKCHCKNKASSLSIDVFEWPLPAHTHSAQSTVFELDRPRAFGNWRDATAYMLTDVFALEYEQLCKPQFSFEPNSCLGEYEQTDPRRIRLLSETKPTKSTHRATYSVEDATLDLVCVKNGLQYRYYDACRKVFVEEQADTDCLRRQCMYSLPQGMSVLQRFLYRPYFEPNGPDPNVAISSQSECPASMSLEEFKALASIPYGTRTQWSNLLVQLALPSIDFKKMETFLVILQTIHQAGPLTTFPTEVKTARQGHQDSLQPSFVGKLMGCLWDALGRIRENWESYQSLAGFIAIANRINNMALSYTISDFLGACRQTVLEWLHTIRDRAREATDSNQRTELLGRAFELALIGTTTFESDEEGVRHNLEHPQAAAHLLELYVNIEETYHSGYSGTNDLLAMAYQRWARLTSRALPTLLDLIVKRGSACLDDVIVNVWADYHQGTPWHSCDGAEHWLTSQSAPKESAESPNQIVHFNLLTGELLVDGMPLSRLPANYEKQNAYVQIFGKATIEVMPTTRPGMQFSSIRTVKGYQSYFGIDGCGEIKLTFAKGTDAWDLIPRRILQNKVPSHFLDNFTHWYHRNTETVEFRPLQTPWVSSPSSWTLHRVLPSVDAAPPWMMRQSDNRLIIDRDSGTSREMARIFSPVEAIPHLHLIWDRARRVLIVALPRLKIQFSMFPLKQQLNSRECRDMYLDTETHIGTLVGLSSKLVLRNNAGKRMLLVPGGKVVWKRQHGHVDVHAVVGTGNMVHHYTVDDQLGRLLDNGSVQSKLYLCYLHALTSYCLPDGLTKKTGTERALEILSETDIPSAARLTQDNVAMLHLISNLAPRRQFYPASLRVMQDVSWDKQLSFLSQHAELYWRARALLDDAARREFFHQGKGELVGLDGASRDCTSLFRRDAIRASTFYRSGFGGDLFTTEHDVFYEGRSDHLQLGERRKAVFFAASRVVNNTDTLQDPSDPNLQNRLWNLFDKADILGPTGQMAVPIEYNAGLFENTTDTMARNWCVLHVLLKRRAATRFDLAVFIATLAFSKGVDLFAIQALCAMYTNQSVVNVVIPQATKFSLAMGREASRGEVRGFIEKAAREFKFSKEASLSRESGETKSELRIRRLQLFESRKDDAVSLFVDMVVSQWPCACPEPPAASNIHKYIDVSHAMAGIRSSFDTWWNNRNFYHYLGNLSQAISGVPRQSMAEPVFAQLAPAPTNPKPRAHTTTDDLFSFAAPTPDATKLVAAATNGSDEDVQMQTDNPALPGLTALSARLASLANQPFKTAYVQDFCKSIDCIRTWSPSMVPSSGMADEQHFRRMLDDAIQRRDIISGLLMESAVGSLPAYQRYNAPKHSPVLFLSQLSHHHWARLSREWQKAIVAYGRAVTDVQRAARIVSACRNPGDLARELANTGHTNWEPLDNPEALLQEIMSGLLTREVQVDIARMMASPPGGHNSAMQLNMGEGKSSVIVPMVAAALADGSRLVMVVVGKPQSKQMVHMLVSKLGGLSGRRIYHMPFSRSLVLDDDHYKEINRMCHECKDSGGIMLVQPEHLLSFQLASPEMAITGQASESASALKTHKFLNDYSRYIVDESDENFSVKFELIYTMGTPSSVELSPERWVLIQAVLDIVQEVALLVKGELPLSIEIEQGSVPGSFPRIRFLRDDGRDRVCKMIAQRVCVSGLQGLPIGRQSPAVRRAIEKYITEAEPSQDTVTAVESCETFWTESVKPRLYLLRGLLGRGILGFAFGSKRWRVNYGIDKSREPPKRLAVPFRAKDSPALKSEFSHPDVVIVLTCLSYYYGGLSHEDLFGSFENLALSDQAAAEYSDWVRSASPAMSAAFHNLSGVNIKDRHQCQEQVFPHLQRSKGAIDFFLSNIVFPKEMNEFPQKLSASGWDIGKETAHPTTGFSGTSDSQHLLPLSVRHLDLPSQRHTNALVLQHLLQPENTVIYMPDMQSPQPPDASASYTATAKGASDAGKLLRLIVDAKPPIQVILDAGAQILELTNVQMAKEWLLLDKSHKEAVVYCGDNDDIMIIDRRGHAETFQTSPFAQQLDRCLVFLDEAHTRGIDLKLPEHYRAAVTLGANLTKDRLVQACMRMRKLGKGQSVAFYVSKEIQDKIAAVPGCSSAGREACTVADVLVWTICETWADLSRSMPLWAVQGARFVRQKQVWAEAYGTTGLTSECATKFLEREAMSLEDHYKPKLAVNTEVASDVSAVEYVTTVLGGSEDAIAQSTLPELEKIVERCRQFDAHQHASTSSLHEEQERELSPEVEEEKQVERPHPLKPAKHILHPDIEKFVATGQLPKTPSSVSMAASTVAMGTASHVPAFWSLSKTSAADHLDVAQFPLSDCLFVSADFARTVVMPARGAVNRSDAYLRPVQWILTVRNSGASGTTATIATMMIISPYEAQNLMPAIKAGRSSVFLHLYAPRSSQSYAPIDHLQLYTVPQPTPPLAREFDHDATNVFSVQLNLFAGQLYFASMSEYSSACRYLGLATEAPTDSSTVVSADGFILAGSGKSAHFKKSPAAFLAVYLPKIRWNCETISRTHWGKVLGGRSLTAAEFDESERDARDAAKSYAGEGEEDDDDVSMKDV